MPSELATGTDAQIWIGPAVARTVDTLTEFQGLTGWVLVGMVERIGARGPRSSVVKGNVISEGVTRKGKGVRDNGSMPLTCFDEPLDPGQQALRAAEDTNNKFAIKVSPRNRSAPGNTDSIQYFRALVVSAEDSELVSDGLNRVSYDLEIDGRIFRVEAT